MKLKELMIESKNQHKNPYTREDLKNIELLLKHLEMTDKDESFNVGSMINTIDKVKSHMNDELKYGI